MPKPPERKTPIALCLYLPPHDSSAIRRFEEKETPTKNIWPLKDIVEFVFPSQYQSRQHIIALEFLRLLEKKESVKGKEIADFLKENRFSKATFYGNVLKKLKRLGMVKVKRVGRELDVSLSKTFGNYLLKISDSWLSFVDEVRSRREYGR